MRSRLIIIFFLFIFKLSLAQGVVYDNLYGDCIIYENDSVFIKLNNKDAFGSYSIFYGKDCIKQSICGKRGTIYTGANMINDYCYSITHKPSDTSTTKLTMIRYDNSPIEYPHITAFRQDCYPLFDATADVGGIIDLNDSLLEESKVVKVSDLGMIIYIDSQSLIIGKDNIIRLLVPYPFVIIDKKVKFYFSSDMSTIVLKHNRIKHTLMLRNDIPEYSVINDYLFRVPN